MKKLLLTTLLTLSLNATLTNNTSKIVDVHGGETGFDIQVFDNGDSIVFHVETLEELDILADLVKKTERERQKAEIEYTNRINEITTIFTNCMKETRKVGKPFAFINRCKTDHDTAFFNTHIKKVHLIDIIREAGYDF